MPVNILMPTLSPTMTEGNLIKWLKREGDAVASGDVLAEIETDKATMELEAVEEGHLGRILVPDGTQAVPVNTTIAVLLEEGEDESALESMPAAAEPAAAATKPTPKPAPKPAPAPAPAPGKGTPPEAAPPSPPKSPAEPPAESPTEPPAGGAAPTRRILASPLARRLAAKAGIELTAIRGTGPRGRIVKADVAAARARPRPAPAITAPAAAATAPAGTAATPFTEVPVSMMRKAIARRVAESKRQAPHFYLTIDCDIDALLRLRKEVGSVASGPAAKGEGAGPGKGESPGEGAGADGIKLSVNDFIVRAVALALGQVPAANVAWAGEVLHQYLRADIAVAVAIPGGLITPVVRDAAGKGLGAISREMRDLAARAREGKLRPEEFQGGTFTVSNLGMYGIREFAAILNPPQACLLAVGRGEPRAVVRDGALAVATVMTCTLAIDHRAVDGAGGAEFLAAFKRLIENPLAILV